MFRFNSTALIVGSTSSGKTHVVKEIVKNADNLLDKRPEKIVICYAEGNGKQFESLKDPRIKLVEGFEASEEILNPDKPTILVLDDLIDKIDADRLTNLVCVGAHHCQLFLVITIHNLFHRKLRTMRINCQYLFLMKNPQDRSSIYRLGCQLLPNKPHFIVEIYEDATKQPYSYLLIDNHQLTEEDMRYKATVLYDGEGITVYTPT